VGLATTALLDLLLVAALAVLVVVVLDVATAYAFGLAGIG
jgi:hypothetical protein